MDCVGRRIDVSVYRYRALRVICDKCRTEIISDEFDDKAEARRYARNDCGMRTRVVRNGSKRDFCKECHEEYERNKRWPT